MKTVPFGLDSALAHAKSLKPYSNMGISAALELELAGHVERQQAMISELEAQAAIGRRAVEMLKTNPPRYTLNPVIDYCAACEQSSGHADNCELAAILRDATNNGMGV